MNDKEKIRKLQETLLFYSNPNTYFAIEFTPYPPCGEFINDFGDVTEYKYVRPMPGKLARETLIETM